MIKDNTFIIYMSHPIRGKKGNDATSKDVEEANNLAKNIGEQLKAYLIDWEKMDGFPKMELYVPADHDEFVFIAYSNGYITETEVLDVDCKIIDKCSLLIVYGDYLSSGMQVEFEHATKKGIPIYKMPTLSDLSIEALRFAIHLILKSGQGN